MFNTTRKNEIYKGGMAIPVLNNTHYVSSHPDIDDHSDVTRENSLAKVIFDLDDTTTTIELPSGLYNLQGNSITVPLNLHIKPNKGVILSNGTLTINGTFEPTDYEVFDNDLTVDGVFLADKNYRVVDNRIKGSDTRATISESTIVSPSIGTLDTIIVPAFTINKQGGFKIIAGGHKTNTNSEDKNIYCSWTDGTNTIDIQFVTDGVDDTSWYFDLICNFNNDLSTQGYTWKAFNQSGIYVGTGDGTVDFSDDVTFSIKGSTGGSDTIILKNFIVELF